MNPKTPKEHVEAEIDKAFAAIELEQKPLFQFLEELDLPELRQAVWANYDSGRGSNRKYDPVAMAYTLIYQDLLDLSRRGMIRRLIRNLNEAKALGHSPHTVPQVQNFSYFVNNKLDEHALELIEHITAYIRQKNREQNKIRGVQQTEEPEEGGDEQENEVEKATQQVMNFLKWKVFPKLSFDRADNAKYDGVELLDLLTFCGMRNVCTNEGYNLLADLADKDVPHARTVRHHIASLDRSDIYSMYEAANERILRLAKEEGRLDKPVDVAIDFTNIQYYGDKNDEMVTEVQPKDGTSHAYQFGTLKVVSGGEHYTLLAVPVSKFDSKTAVVEELLSYAEDVVDIERVYADRGFFTTDVLNLIEERGHRYLVPAIRNSKIRGMLEERDEEGIERYTMGSGDTATFNLVFREGRDGDLKPFATNCNHLEILTNNLFDLYGRRWDIETGYRVQKENFYPKTTSKDYNIRLFYFLFSQLLYNAWILTNVVVSFSLFDELRGEKIVSAQELVTAFFKAYIDYG